MFESWYLFLLVSEEMEVNLPAGDNNTISRLCKRFNEQLIFCPSDLRKFFLKATGHTYT